MQVFLQILYEKYNIFTNAYLALVTYKLSANLIWCIIFILERLRQNNIYIPPGQIWHHRNDDSGIRSQNSNHLIITIKIDNEHDMIK